MEVPKNQLPANLLDNTILASKALQELMDVQELMDGIEAMFNNLGFLTKQAARLALKNEIKKTGYSLSGWKKAIDTLTERLEAMQHSDEKAKKDFKSHLSSLIKKLGKLSNLCEKMRDRVTDSSELNQNEKDELYPYVVRFKSRIDVLISHLVAIQEALGIKKR